MWRRREKVLTKYELQWKGQEYVQDKGMAALAFTMVGEKGLFKDKGMVGEKGLG